MIDDKMHVGLDLGGILGRFWMDFAKVWEAKLDQKSIKNRYGKVIEFLIEKRGGGAPKAPQLAWGGVP